MTDAAENEEFETCRLCSLKRCRQYNPTLNTKQKHSELIQKVTGTNILLDTDKAPQNVCEVCVIQLKRELKKIHKKVGGKLRSWDVPNFEKAKHTHTERCVSTASDSSTSNTTNTTGRCKHRDYTK